MRGLQPDHTVFFPRLQRLESKHVQFYGHPSGRDRVEERKTGLWLVECMKYRASVGSRLKELKIFGAEGLPRRSSLTW